MRLVCPNCETTLEVKLDDMMGLYCICKTCHFAFRWEKHLYVADPES